MDFNRTCEAGYAGQVYHCPLHKAAPAMYEALKKIVAEGTRCLDECQQDKPVREIYDINEVDRIARLALAQEEDK